MTPPRIRGLVDKLDRAVRLEVYAKPAEKRARKNEALRVKMEILKAFAVISAAAPSAKKESGYYSDQDWINAGCPQQKESE